MDPVNFIALEVFMIVYTACIAAWSHFRMDGQIRKLVFQVGMLIATAIHLFRLIDYERKITISRRDNLIIVWIVFAILAYAFMDPVRERAFLVAGILAGSLMFVTYYIKEGRVPGKFNWLKWYIDIPMTLFSLYFSHYGYTRTFLPLFPIFGDLIYHVLEFLFFY